MNKKVAISGLCAVLSILTFNVIQHQAIQASSFKCESSDTEGSTDLKGLSDQFIVSNQAFSFKLYRALLANNVDDNVFLSPMSVATVLAMLHNGTHGQTKTDLVTSLELAGLTSAEINQGYLALQKSLESVAPDVRVAIANSLWTHEELPIKSQFCQESTTYYRASATELDFADPQSLSTINQWVKNKTQQKIQQILQRLKPSDALVLVNALYFKGDWQEKFDPDKTREHPFFIADGQTKLHPLMWQRGKYDYFENDDFQAINLPYGNGRMSLYIFLPRQDDGLATFHQDLNSINWAEWLNSFQERAGTIEFPRFKLESTYQLKDSLEALGMQRIFDEQLANFSDLTDVKVAVGQVTHKTFVEVNEEGTEAAAVTGIITAINAPIVESPFEMKVDRPFFMALRDNETKTLLFLGTISNP